MNGINKIEGLEPNEQEFSVENNHKLYTYFSPKSESEKNAIKASENFLGNKRNHSPINEKEKENNNYYSNPNTPSLSISTKHSNACSTSMKKDRNISDFFKPSSGLIYNSSSTNSKTNTRSILPLQNNNSPVFNEKIILDKEREIEDLKQQINYNEEKLTQIEQHYQSEIEKTNMCLIESLKEVETAKRINKKQRLHEKKMKIGHFNSLKTINGQILENWVEGEDYLKIRSRIKELHHEKQLIDNDKKRLSDSLLNDNQLSFDEENKNDLLYLRNHNVIKEEVYLRHQLSQLDHEKMKFLIEDNLFTQEARCYFCTDGKNPWPLLNNRFQILSLLGRGGYSEVYKAYDIKEHTIVACKIFLINQNWPKEICDNYLKHCHREIQIQKDINHNKVVKQLSSFNIDGASYCTVLEYCTGPDLGTYMKLNKNINEAEAQNIIKQILLGLEYLNKQKRKIIHYDIKPQNILFHNHEVKISDFGISKIIQGNEDKTELTSQGIGTYWYLPPECFEDASIIQISHKVDIWSVGVILFEMLFGKKPFGQGCSHGKLASIMSNARKVIFPQSPFLSRECEEFIMKCLSWRIENRYDIFDALKSPFITKVYKDYMTQ